MNKRVRELELELSEARSQIDERDEQIAQLKKDLTAYQNREQAIVMALTEAQSTAARRIELAKEEAAAILKAAEEQKQTLEEQTDGILAKANEEAAAIREQSIADAQTRLRQTEASVAEYELRLSLLNDQLKKTAAQAQAQAEQFAAFLNGTVIDTPDAVDEVRDLHKLVAEEIADLPEQYDSPSELMHSIYQIQGRQLPDEETAFIPPLPAQEAPAQEASGDEERVWTVDEVISNAANLTDADPDIPDLDGLLDEILQP